MLKKINGGTHIMSKYKITVKVKKQHIKFKKLKKQINNLKINSEEMSEELCRMIAEAKIRDEEMRYMQDFIRWKNPDDVYAVFRQKAYEDPDSDLPFPHLIM